LAKFEYTEKHLIDIRNHPHLLGHIANKPLLTQLHSQWIRYVWEAVESVTLQAHRGSYKTTAIIIIGAIWWLLFHPDDRIAIIRKTWTMAAQVVKAISQIMQMPEIQMLFKYAQGSYPTMKTKRDGVINFNFKSTATPEASIQALGLDASITGMHFDKTMGDDFVTLRDRLSKAERQKTIEVIREISTNIIDKGKPDAWIGTPWHKYDGWSILPEPEKFDVKRCGILTEKEVEEKKRKTLPSLYAANYDLKHMADESKLFADPTWEKWRWDIVGRVSAQLDAAFSGDHTNGLTVMAKKKDGRVQAAGFSDPGHVKNWIPTVAKILERYRVKTIYIETNPDKGWTAEALRANPIVRRRGIRVKEYAESQNKHIKIASNLYEHWKNIIWDEESDMEYMEQVVDYSEGQEPDDAPDSAASLLKRHFSTPVVEGNPLWEIR